MQPSRARPDYQISCCLVGLYFLCEILLDRPVLKMLFYAIFLDREVLKKKCPYWLSHKKMFLIKHIVCAWKCCGGCPIKLLNGNMFYRRGCNHLTVAAGLDG